MKKNFYSFLKILLITIFLISFCFSLVFGKDEEKPVSLESPLPGLPKEATFKQYFQGLVNFAVGLAGLILFSVFIYGAFLYLLSAGDPNKKEEAKRKIKQAIIGVSLLLLLYLVYRTLFEKTTVFIPSPPKWPLSSLVPGIWMCSENVNQYSTYFDKNKAGEAMLIIEEKCKHYFPGKVDVISEEFSPKVVFNIPSNPWTTPSYESMTIIGSGYEPAERASLIKREEESPAHKIGKIKGIIKFEKGEISFPEEGKVVIILKKTTPPSGNGITFYPCEYGWDKTHENCPERITEILKQGGGYLEYSISAKSDFQEISPPKVGEIDFSSDTRAIKVDSDITAIFCNSAGNCTLVVGPQKMNVYEMGSTVNGGIAVPPSPTETSSYQLRSDIEKIYIIKGRW